MDPSRKIVALNPRRTLILFVLIVALLTISGVYFGWRTYVRGHASFGTDPFRLQAAPREAPPEDTADRSFLFDLREAYKQRRLTLDEFLLYRASILFGTSHDLPPAYQPTSAFTQEDDRLPTEIRLHWPHLNLATQRILEPLLLAPQHPRSVFHPRRLSPRFLSPRRIPKNEPIEATLFQFGFQTETAAQGRLVFAYAPAGKGSQLEAARPRLRRTVEQAWTKYLAFLHMNSAEFRPGGIIVYLLDDPIKDSRRVQTWIDASTINEVRPGQRIYRIYVTVGNLADADESLDQSAAHALFHAFQFRQMIMPGGEDFFLEGTARMAEGLVVKSARRGPDLQRAFQQPGISLWNRITDAAPFWSFLMQRRGERAGVFLRQLFESTGRDSAPDALFRAAEIGRYWHEYSRALMYQPPFESLDNSDELALRPDYPVSVAQLRSIPRRTVQHIDGVLLAPLSSTRIDLYVPLAEYLDLELLSRSGQYPPGLEVTLILSPNGQVVDWTGQWHYQLCRTLSRPCRDQRRHPTVTSVQVILSNRDPKLPLEVELIASSSNSHWIAESVQIDNATLPVLGDLELLLLDDKTLQLNARRVWFDWNEGFYPYAPSGFARKMVIDYLKSHAAFRGSARYHVTRRRSESDLGPILFRLDTRRIQEGNYHGTPFGFVVERDPHWYRLGGRFRNRATAFLNEMELWEQNPPAEFGPRASAVFKRIMQLEDPIFYTYAEGARYERLTLLFKNMRIVFRPAES